MAFRYRVNLPGPSRLDPVKAEKTMAASLTAFAVGTQRVMMVYPPAQPWKNPPPRTGPRAGGRRTGTYGRGWALGNSIVRKGKWEIRLQNPTTYAVWVGGPTDEYPGQARFMGPRGWVSLPDVANKVLQGLLVAKKFKIID